MRVLLNDHSTALTSFLIVFINNFVDGFLIRVRVISGCVNLDQV